MKAAEKIKSLDELAPIVEQARAEGRRIILCHGVFDLLHPGHIRHLEAARREGDVLVVTVTSDDRVNKGPGRPVFDHWLRMESLAALASVDHVALCENASAIPTIRRLRPDIYVKGSDYADRDADITGKILEEETAVREVGGHIHFTNEISFSSSRLINQQFDVFTEEARDFLDGFRQRYSADEVVEKVRMLKDLRVLVIGDCIIDEYFFCTPIGMASKSTTVTTKLRQKEIYAGGALAIANHLAGFCDRVDLVTCLGVEDSRENFVRGALKKNIKPHLFTRPDGPTISKRRYVHPFLMVKMFEVASYNDEPISDELETRVRDHLAMTAGEYDLVLVGDFGHGFLGSSLIRTICDKAKFLAINAQSNGLNMGYNLVTKYPRADYVCIDREEIRLAHHDRFGPLEPLLENLAGNLDCHLVTATLGHGGSLTFSPNGGFVRVPVFSRELIDTTGAGDAFLSIASAGAAAGWAPELVSFIGNVAGAMSVQIVGNKESIEPIAFLKYITTLLK